MASLLSAALVVVGVIHLLPAAGVLGAGRLKALYGVDVDEPNLQILMRHRAVLFALFWLFSLGAAFHPPWQGAALVGGFGSVGSFLVLARSVGSFNAELRRVVLVDVVALAGLAVGAAAWWVSAGG